MSWKKDASMYILSEKISAPIATNVDPDIKEEYFLKKVNIFDLKFTFDENIGNNYIRLRIGINHPGDKEKVTGHVLGDFSKEENEEFEKILKKIVKNFDLLIDTNIKKFQSNMK